MLRVGRHELVFPDGPIHAAAQLPGASRALPNACTSMFSWWGDDLDVALALESVARTVRAVGGCDAVLGFSQGGALAAYVCRATTPPLVGGWRPRAAVLLNAYAVAAKQDAGAPPPAYAPHVASLHAWGRLDQVVRPALSEKLCADMRGGASPLETGGHAVPPPPFGDNVLVPWLHANVGSGAVVAAAAEVSGPVGAESRVARYL